MMYPKKKKDIQKMKKRSGSKGDDSEILALNKLLHDLDDEIDRRTLGKKLKKKTPTKKKKGKKIRSKTPTLVSNEPNSGTRFNF